MHTIGQVTEQGQRQRQDWKQNMSTLCSKQNPSHESSVDHAGNRNALTGGIHDKFLVIAHTCTQLTNG